MSTKWKYRIHNVRFTLDYRRSLQEACDILGKSGWELVTATRSWSLGYTLFFKRASAENMNQVK